MILRRTVKRLGLALASIGLIISPALIAAPSAQAWGEVTYPGTGWATSSTVYRDVVYCLGSNGAYWLEVKVDSIREARNGQVWIDPFAISVTRTWHDSNNAHQYYYWQGSHWNHKVHINQGVGAVPQQIVNTWNPGWISFSGDPTTTWSQGLNWSDSQEQYNPHLYVSIIGRYYGPPGSTAYTEVYDCSVDLGP